MYLYFVKNQYVDRIGNWNRAKLRSQKKCFRFIVDLCAEMVCSVYIFSLWAIGQRRRKSACRQLNRWKRSTTTRIFRTMFFHRQKIFLEWNTHTTALKIETTTEFPHHRCVWIVWMVNLFIDFSSHCLPPIRLFCVRSSMCVCVLGCRWRAMLQWICVDDFPLIFAHFHQRLCILFSRIQTHTHTLADGEKSISFVNFLLPILMALPIILQKHLQCDKYLHKIFSDCSLNRNRKISSQRKSVNEE